VIEYAYTGVLDTNDGKLYLEANSAGTILLICLGVPCDRPLEIEEAVRMKLEPFLSSPV
jgi:hypothetical protein